MIVQPLTGKAKQAVGHTAPIVAMEGSIRSGKTWASLLEWLEYCRRGPAGHLLMTGKTERTIITNLVLPLQQWLGERRVKLNRGLGWVRIMGREVMIVGANNEAAVTKIQGRTLAGAYVDEASTLPDVFFDMLHSRLSVEGAQLFLTSNPETPAHWLKTKWLDRASLWIDRTGQEVRREVGSKLSDGREIIDLVRVSFTLEDNADNLPPSYVRNLKAAHTGLWYRRYILGEWCIAEDAVYSDWDPGRHVLAEKDMPEIAEYLGVGVDYGTTNPTRGLLLGLSAESPPRLVVVDEWAPANQQTDAALVRDFKRWLGSRPAAWICLDPSAASLKLALFEGGLDAILGSNRVIPGIRLVGSLLHQGALVVSDRCVELIKEIPGYSWDAKATARGEDEPMKVDDHACDALRYAVATTRRHWGAYVPIVTTVPDELEEAA